MSNNNNPPPKKDFGKDSCNKVSLRGKISRLGILAYTPSGLPLCEVTVAVMQRHLEKESVGYFELVFNGRTAEDISRQLKIGDMLSIEGNLWSRQYKNRQGSRVTETKVLVSSFTI